MAVAMPAILPTPMRPDSDIASAWNEDTPAADVLPRRRQTEHLHEAAHLHEARADRKIQSGTQAQIDQRLAPDQSIQILRTVHSRRTLPGFFSCGRMAQEPAGGKPCGHEESSKLEGVRWLAQGTIYPDVIESAGAKTGKAHVIKSISWRRRHTYGGVAAGGGIVGKLTSRPISHLWRPARSGRPRLLAGHVNRVTALASKPSSRRAST